MDHRTKFEPKNIQLREQNIGEKLYDSGLSQCFLDMTLLQWMGNSISLRF